MKTKTHMRKKTQYKKKVKNNKTKKRMRGGFGTTSWSPSFFNPYIMHSPNDYSNDPSRIPEGNLSVRNINGGKRRRSRYKQNKIRGGDITNNAFFSFGNSNGALIGTNIATGQGPTQLTPYENNNPVIRTII